MEEMANLVQTEIILVIIIILDKTLEQNLCMIDHLMQNYMDKRMKKILKIIMLEILFKSKRVNFHNLSSNKTKKI